MNRNRHTVDQKHHVSRVCVYVCVCACVCVVEWVISSIRLLNNSKTLQTKTFFWGGGFKSECTVSNKVDLSAYSHVVTNGWFSSDWHTIFQEEKFCKKKKIFLSLFYYADAKLPSVDLFYYHVAPRWVWSINCAIRSEVRSDRHAKNAEWLIIKVKEKRKRSCPAVDSCRDFARQSPWEPPPLLPGHDNK